MILLLIILFGIIILMEAPGLIRNKYWKELIVFGILLTMGFVLSILMVLDVHLPHVTAELSEFIITTFKLKLPE